MNDAGYILAGYLVTAATVATYAWSIRSRTRRVEGTLVFAPDVPHLDVTDDEG